MLIAGLDIATETGVCVGELGQTPEFFSRDLGHGKTHDLRFSNIMRLANYLVKDRGVEFIGIEAPIIIPKRDGKAKLELLFGLIANVRGWAHLQGVRCEIINIDDLDAAFLGGKQRKGGRKPANRARCADLGWNPITEDEADAGSVYFSACAKIDPDFAITHSPLFGNARVKDTSFHRRAG